MRQDRRNIVVIFTVSAAYLLLLFVIISYYFGPIPFNPAVPVFFFFSYLCLNFLFGAVAIAGHVAAGFSDRIRRADRKKLPFFFWLVYDIIFLTFYDFLYTSMPSSISFRQTPSIFSAVLLQAIWISTLSVIAALLIIREITERRKREQPSHLSSRIVVSCAISVMMLACAISTYQAVPDLSNQRVVPDGMQISFMINGSYTTSFFTAVRNGTLEGNVSSTSNLTVYVLDSAQFRVLANLTGPGSPPLPSNYQPTNFLFSSVTSSSADFSIQLVHGSYVVVYFNRGEYGSVITVHSLIFRQVGNT